MSFISSVLCIGFIVNKLVYIAEFFFPCILIQIHNRMYMFICVTLLQKQIFIRKFIILWNEFLKSCATYVLQDDDDGHMTVLQIMQDLMLKCQEVFLEHFARLGLFSRVLGLAGPPFQDEEGAKSKDDKVIKTF